MNNAELTIIELRDLERSAEADSPYHRLSPLSKLFLTLFYIAVTASFGKYDISGLFFMVLFPVTGLQLSGLSLGTCLYKIRKALPLVLFIGVLNPFFDRTPVMQIAGVAVSGGVLSMLTILLKGVFSLMASFLLISTTSADEICLGLRKIHFPKILTSLFLLTFRYISVLLEEVSTMTEAYSLRAPGQKGIHISVWGTFLGQLVLRTMDRADRLYDSMRLRGFSGEFTYAEGRKPSRWSWAVTICLCVLMAAARLFNLPALLAALLMRR